MSYLQQVFIKTLFQTFSKVPVVFWLKATLIFSSVCKQERKTFKTVSDAEEEFSIYYEDICTTNISDDSGFIEVSTPSTPATPFEWKGSQIYLYLL
jgi:hypothetical protein